MAGRQVALYFAWSRPDETAAPLGILEDRFPALFELRRMFWPRFEQFADAVKFDQGIGGFLDNIQLANFKPFAIWRRHGPEIRSGKPNAKRSPACARSMARFSPASIRSLLSASTRPGRSSERATRRSPLCDTTTWSSTAGGLDSLQRFWRNVVQLKRADG
jgi:hypothetical protein